MEVKLELPQALAELLAEVNAADSDTFLPIDIRPGENILGGVSLYARKLFAVMRYYSQEEDLQKVRAGHAPNDPSLMAEYLRFHQKYQAFNALFWLVARAEAGVDALHVGVRRAGHTWHIVEVKDDGQPGMPPGLLAIFGEL